MSEIERDDVVSIMTSLKGLHEKADIILEYLGETMKRKRKLDAEFWRRDAEMKRMLEERIAFHKAKIAEEAAQKG